MRTMVAVLGIGQASLLVLGACNEILGIGIPEHRPEGGGGAAGGGGTGGAPVPGCGDGSKDDGEACDDGNTQDCDGCRGDCSAIESGCGDAFVCPPEACDNGDANSDTGERAPTAVQRARLRRREPSKSRSVR